MHVERFTLGPLGNNTYLLVDEATRDAAVVDPTFESESLWTQILAQQVTVRYILNTHGHFDHILGNAFYSEQTGAPIAVHSEDLLLIRLLSEQIRRWGVPLDPTPSPEPGILLSHGQTLPLGRTELAVRFTPGHSPGHVTFVADGQALVGDCLFAGSIGRTDIPGASQETLFHSLRTQLLTLPDETIVWPGHGRPTTIGEERRSNPFLRPDPS